MHRTKAFFITTGLQTQSSVFTCLSRSSASVLKSHSCNEKNTPGISKTNPPPPTFITYAVDLVSGIYVLKSDWQTSSSCLHHVDLRLKEKRVKIYRTVQRLNGSERNDERYITMALMTIIMVMVPLPPHCCPHLFLMGEKLQGVFDRQVSQEDDSGVNHLWKGEMWPARVEPNPCQTCAEHQRSRCKQLKQLSVSCRDLF